MLPILYRHLVHLGLQCIVSCCSGDKRFIVLVDMTQEYDPGVSNNVPIVAWLMQFVGSYITKLARWSPCIMCPAQAI